MSQSRLSARYDRNLADLWSNLLQGSVCLLSRLFVHHIRLFARLFCTIPHPNCRDCIR